MATNVNTVVELANFISNKVQIGNTVKVGEQLNNLLDTAQMMKYNRDRNTFVQTGETSDFLESFLKEKLVGVPSTGIIPYPTDYEHTSAIGYYADKMWIPVTSITNNEYFEIMRSQLKVPDAEFPKYTEHASTYKFLPMNIGTVNIQYFKTPLKPVWGFTIINGRAVYNATTSVDFEFNSFAMNDVVGCYLQLLGINILQPDLMKFSQQFSSENNNPL